MIRQKDLIFWTAATMLAILLMFATGCAERHGPEWHPRGRDIDAFRYCRDHHQGIHLPNDEILRPASEIASAR